MSRALIFCLILFLFSCGNSKPEKIDNPTEGDIRVGVEDAYKLLLDTEIFTFTSQYPKAKVTPHYGAESDLIDLFIKDSVSVVVLGRELNDAEKEAFKARKLFPKVTRIAYDGLAFVVNPASPDSNFSFSKLRELFTGKISTWSGLKGQPGADSLKIVFDHPHSGNVRSLMEKFEISKLPPSCYSVSSNEEVIKYVEKNKYAIGIVSSNWISDPQDSLSENILKTIRVAGISSNDDPEALSGYKRPYQAYIANDSYPFKRPVYIINAGLGMGLGTGFVSFVAGDKGQRIILRSGLVPAFGVVRMVNVNSEE